MTVSHRQRPAYWFATCQVGAERALKAELASRWPAFHLAFSRPGFLTFKLPADNDLSDGFHADAVFARSSGFSLGRVTGDSLQVLAEGVWKLAGQAAYDVLHVWQRDTAAPGHRGFEPGNTPAAQAANDALRRHAPDGTPSASCGFVARLDQLVLDCVLVGPCEWWIGYHRAGRWETRYPGGFVDIPTPRDAVSRAYAKMEEALLWSDLPIRSGDQFVAIGCAPGGASQALLARGLKVIGIDPAEVDPHVLEHANFTHIRKRGADVRRREFRDAKWLGADMNVAPQYTLDTVEAIVTHPATHIEGLLLTLKLLDWGLAAEIPAYLDRIRSWGYGEPQARQLARNRQEVCVAASGANEYESQQVGSSE